MLIGRDDIISIDNITLGTCFQCLFTFTLVSALRWLAEIWQLTQQGVTGELEVEFKFQWPSCKLSFLGELACRLCNYSINWHILKIILII